MISIIIRKMNTLCTNKTRVIYFCSNWVNFLPENVHFFSLFFGSGVGRQLPSPPTTSSPTSCDYGYIEWQRVTTSSTTSDNEWQRVKTNVNEWYKEWQRVTTSGRTSDNKWQRVKTNVNEWYKEWQRVTTSGTTSGNEWQRVTTNDSEWQQMTMSDSVW